MYVYVYSSVYHCLQQYKLAILFNYGRSMMCLDKLLTNPIELSLYCLTRPIHRPMVSVIHAKSKRYGKECEKRLA